MQLSANDVAVIEQALREAVNNGHDYQKVLAYREVLSKLQGMPPGQEWKTDDVRRELPLDGFRYDYDDHAGP